MMLLTVKSVTALALIVFGIAAVAAAPYQELAPRKGYVPVYIRIGDTPLSEIHPGLAEAFHEFSSESLTLGDDQKSETPNAPSAEEKPAAEPAKTSAPAAEKTAEQPIAVEATNESAKVAAPEASETSKESDIASFDVIKSLDNADQHCEQC